MPIVARPEPEPEPKAEPLVPKRPFGSSGVRVSKLCLGGGAFSPDKDWQPLIDQALKLGVDFWEISLFGAKMFAAYFNAHPDARKKVFLSGKTHSKDPSVMQEHLDKALTEAGTPWIDFFAIHTIDHASELTDDIRRWADKAKKDGKIRFFGFCTHTNMEKTIHSAADLGWIDGIQTFYNHRMRAVPSMEDAIGKCHHKGIGVVSVKSMAVSLQTRASLQALPLNEAKLQSLLSPHRMTFEQAKLRAIWQNPGLTSICSLMSTSEMLKSNAAAAMDEAPLPAEVDRWLQAYAGSTARYFCRRCSDNCEGANADRIPICSILQLLMMARGYDGYRGLCAKMFGQFPDALRKKILTSDYSLAEKRCPQGIPIAQLISEAHQELSA